MNRSLPRRRPARLLAATLAVAALALGACGGDDDTAEADEAATTEPSTPTVAPATPGGTTAAEPAEPFTVRIGLVSSARSVGGPIGWGEESGILLERLGAAGVTGLEVLVFPTGPPLVAALQAGEVDVISTGDVPSINAAADGLDSRLIQIASSGSDSWLIGQPDGPTDIADLVGKTVTAPPGTAPERFVRGLIEDAGLADQIAVTNLATPDAITALRAGQVDAVPVSGVQAAALAAEGFTVIAKASDHPGLTSTSTIVAREGFLAEHPGFATAFAAAWTATVEDLTTNFDEFLEWYAAIEDAPVDVVASVISADQYPTEPFPESGLELLDNTVTFLLDQGILEEPFDIHDWIYRD